MRFLGWFNKTMEISGLKKKTLSWHSLKSSDNSWAKRELKNKQEIGRGTDYGIANMK